jgi:uncharacterized membrane protein YedE/YeeE
LSGRPTELLVPFTAAGVRFDAVLEIVPLCLPFFFVAAWTGSRIADPAIDAAVDAALVSATAAVRRVLKLLLALPVPVG